MPPRSRSAFRTSIGLALLVAATGCAQTKVSRVWSDQSLKKDQYGRVMVVAAVPNFNRRQTAEKRIVAELVDGGATAMRSFDVLSQDDVTDRERVRSAVANAKADALLVVRVTASDKEQVVSEGREQWVPMATGIDYYGYVSTSYGLYRKPDTSQVLSWVIETTLWDVASEHMVWACQTDTVTARENITTAELADDYAAVMAKKVRPYLRHR